MMWRNKWYGQVEQFDDHDDGEVVFECWYPTHAMAMAACHSYIAKWQVLDYEIVVINEQCL